MTKLTLLKQHARPRVGDPVDTTQGMHQVAGAPKLLDGRPDVWIVPIESAGAPAPR